MQALVCSGWFLWLWLVSPGAVTLRPRCPVPCGVLIPWPGIEPTFPALQGGCLTTGPPRRSPFSSFSFFLNFLTFFLVLPHKHSILSATKSSHVYHRWLNFTLMHLNIYCLCQGESLHGSPSSPTSSITLSRPPAQITTTPVTCLGAPQGFHWPLFCRWWHVPGQGALFCWRKYHHFHSDT